MIPYTGIALLPKTRDYDTNLPVGVWRGYFMLILN